MIASATGLKKFGGGRVEYVSELIQERVDKILDIGSSYGWTLGSLAGKANELWGIDVDRTALLQAEQTYPNLKLIHQTAAQLPFESNMFDVVILSEVIEHVGDENKQTVIDEAWRVLKTGGLFIFTAPYEGWFAWADHLDFKRRLPSVYKTYMNISKYTPDTPVEVGHKHLSLDEIHQLFGDRFQIEDIQFCGLFMPFINWILAVGERLKLLPRPIINTLNCLQDWESGVRYPQFLAFNLRLKAHKK
jgi:ubiquinone/menaquinone biosynthesis C-methylase UbiE